MAEAQTKKIAIITGSTRKKRVGPQVAKFISGILESQLTSISETSFILSPIDIANFNLPVYDEEVTPAMVPTYAQFSHEHSKAWSSAISDFDGYVVVTATYNGGIPGALKNAIDYLYNELIGKPVMIISYGITGGNHASDALKTTFEVMQLKVVETRPLLAFPKPEGEMQGPIAPSVASALQGVLLEDCLVAWERQRDEIVKGFGELKGILVEKQRK